MQKGTSGSFAFPFKTCISGYAGICWELGKLLPALRLMGEILQLVA